MSRRKNPNDDPAGTEPSFEDALASLEAIVEAMEQQQLPLEELVAYYEKGAVLLDRCESLLQGARQRIELITLRNKAESGTAAESGGGEPSGPSPTSGEPDASDDDDDIRLF